MLFPLAEYDLDTFFAQPLPEPFREEHVLHEALLGLSSAIEALHNYIWKDYSLELIGCHYDLRPKNILVEGRKFLLSDFGLSRLKAQEEGSRSMFKAAVGDFVAPECYADEAAFRKGSIGRASDVWSFGCILLLVATHAREGTPGVDEFANRRKVTITTDLGPLSHHQFHKSGRLNPAVSEQISRHKSGNSILAPLAEDMLEIIPEKRLNSTEVSQRLFLIAMNSLCKSVWERFSLLLASVSPSSEELGVESERFRSWFHGLYPNELQILWERQKDLFHSGMGPLQSILSALHELKIELQNLAEDNDDKSALRPIYTPLRQTITFLWNHVSLSQERKETIRTDWINRVLNSEDITILKQRHIALVEQNNAHDITMLTAMKYMASLANQGLSTGAEALIFEPKAVEVDEDRREYSLGTMRDTGQRILIERIRYRPFWVKNGTKDVGRELYSRVGAIAEIMSLKHKPTELRTLECIGYYHDQPLQSFALAFALSPLSMPQSFDRALLEAWNPTSLHDILCTYRIPSTRPPLGEVFQLAHALATSVLSYHQIGWLHKDICSFNVLFLPPSKGSKSASAAPPITSPYLIGFKHSRQDEFEAFSTGIQGRDERRLHLHPDYQPQTADEKAEDDEEQEKEQQRPVLATERPPPAEEERYRLEFDYYSLGLILLEIGLWYSLHDIHARFVKASGATTAAAAVSAHQRRKNLLRHAVPSLGCAAGAIFRDAVRFCLDERGWREIRDGDGDDHDGGATGSDDDEGAKEKEGEKKRKKEQKEKKDRMRMLVAFDEHVVRPLRLCRA